MKVGDLVEPYVPESVRHFWGDVMGIVINKNGKGEVEVFWSECKKQQYILTHFEKELRKVGK